ncbi:unnamed protein product [Pseudo-nitzschia multistriata]|uniref:DUF6816 domain-containing protein n=1 Tax=Pseudo-nitzschia multistriata TaxID=183589 RepID=A0A448YWA0_9STRA|nr:unnamed protein product [Pseudo-nitzschia multistriata]
MKPSPNTAIGRGTALAFLWWFAGAVAVASGWTTGIATGTTRASSTPDRHREIGTSSSRTGPLRTSSPGEPEAARPPVEGLATRRELVAAAGGCLGAAAVLAARPAPSGAAEPLDAGEAIRRGASNLPGYGSSDVFYLGSFAGSWKMTREVEFPSSPNVLRLSYPVRFVQSIEDGAVVADRGYNQAELEAALARTRSGASGPDGSAPEPASPAVRSYEWVPYNPNVLRVVLSSGTQKEIKVTKRATERTEDTVSSSEFQRVTTQEVAGPNGNNNNGVGGIPDISARRVVSKWKRVDDSTLEGIEIVYAVGGGGDPLSAGLSSSPQAAPRILSKSRLYLVR